MWSLDFLRCYTPVWKQVVLSVLDTPVAVLVTVNVIVDDAPFQKVTVVVTALPLTAVTNASAPNALVVVAPL